MVAVYVVHVPNEEASEEHEDALPKGMPMSVVVLQWNANAES